MPKNMMDSACIIIAVIVLVTFVLLADAFAAQQEEYVIMSKETFEQIVKLLKVCQGGRI